MKILNVSKKSEIETAFVKSILQVIVIDSFQG